MTVEPETMTITAWRDYAKILSIMAGQAQSFLGNYCGFFWFCQITSSNMRLKGTCVFLLLTSGISNLKSYKCNVTTTPPTCDDDVAFGRLGMRQVSEKNGLLFVSVIEVCSRKGWVVTQSVSPAAAVEGNHEVT